MTGRSVPEWIGKTPDTAIPLRVKLRIWEREQGICHLSGRKIRPGEPYDFDHKIALINGGEHRESNLFPALRDKHREKTALDVAEKAESARIRSKHIGAKTTSHPMPGSKASGLKKLFNGRVEKRQ